MYSLCNLETDTRKINWHAYHNTTNDSKGKDVIGNNKKINNSVYYHISQDDGSHIHIFFFPLQLR